MPWQLRSVYDANLSHFFEKKTVYKVKISFIGIVFNVEQNQGRAEAERSQNTTETIC